MDLTNCKLIKSCEGPSIKHSQSSKKWDQSSFKPSLGAKFSEKPKKKLTDSKKVKLSPGPKLEINTRKYFIRKLSPLDLKNNFKPSPRVYDYLYNPGNSFPIHNFFHPKSLTPIQFKEKRADKPKTENNNHLFLSSYVS